MQRTFKISRRGSAVSCWGENRAARGLDLHVPKNLISSALQPRSRVCGSDLQQVIDETKLRSNILARELVLLTCFSIFFRTKRRKGARCNS
jgi:hypothetical protein